MFYSGWDRDLTEVLKEWIFSLCSFRVLRQLLPRAMNGSTAATWWGWEWFPWSIYQESQPTVWGSPAESATPSPSPSSSLPGCSSTSRLVEDSFSGMGVRTDFPVSRDASCLFPPSQLDTGKTFQVRMRFDTDVELAYFHHGGILNYMIRKMSEN